MGGREGYGFLDFSYLDCLLLLLLAVERGGVMGEWSCTVLYCFLLLLLLSLVIVYFLPLCSDGSS